MFMPLSRATRCSIPTDAEYSFIGKCREVANKMGTDEIYDEILPYLSDPKSIKEFLDTHKESSVEEMIEDINKLMEESDVPLKTDLRILLNALLKRS